MHHLSIFLKNGYVFSATFDMNRLSATRLPGYDLHLLHVARWLYVDNSLCFFGIDLHTPFYDHVP